MPDSGIRLFDLSKEDMDKFRTEWKRFYQRVVLWERIHSVTIDYRMKINALVNLKSI